MSAEQTTASEKVIDVTPTEVASEIKGPLDDVEVQKAAGYYAQLAKKIRGFSRTMGGKGLARVMIAVAEFPYADSYPAFRSDAEKQLFTFMLTIQSTKGTIAKALEADAKEIEHKATDGIVEEVLAKQGENDGKK